MAQASFFVLRINLKSYQPLGQGVKFQDQGPGTIQMNPDSQTQDVIFKKPFIEITDFLKIIHNSTLALKQIHGFHFSMFSIANAIFIAPFTQSVMPRSLLSLPHF